MILFFLIGCQATSMEQPNDEEPSYTKLSTQNEFDQQLSNQVKEYLKDNKDLTSVQAVNDEEKILITFEIPHMKRFKLADIRKELKKDIKEKFQIKKVEVSTDQKVILELDKLEEEIQDKSVNKNELKKELKRIIKLSKKQT